MKKSIFGGKVRLNNIVPSFIEGDGTKIMYDMIFHYKTADFPTLARHVSGYSEHPVLEIYIKSRNNKPFYAASFGWEKGEKYDIGFDYLDNDVASKDEVTDLAGFLVDAIEEYFRDTLYHMIAEALESHKAYTVIYNKEKDSERTMYEKYFGKNINQKASLFYKFYPEVNLLAGTEDIQSEIKHIITPEVEIIMTPAEEIDRYNVQCFCGAAEINYKIEYEEVGTDEYVPYPALTAYLKNWIEELCREFNWAVIIKQIIADKKIEDLSLELREYLSKNTYEIY